MKRFSILISAAVVLAASSAFAQQQPTGKSADASSSFAQQRATGKSDTSRADQKQYKFTSPGEVQATPEMWFYEQERKDSLDPDLAVRRAAEFRADQRMRRMEARKWFGLSNARPTAGVDMIHGDYSPGWSSNSYYPFRWVGNGPTTIVVRPDDNRR